jgi:hypothetical protein
MFFLNLILENFILSSQQFQIPKCRSNLAANETKIKKSSSIVQIRDGPEKAYLPQAIPK